MQTVFRIQDQDGRGPFKPGFTKKWSIDRADKENLVPWFQEFGRVDLKVLYGATAGSACETLEQLRRWFSKEEYNTLKELGYKAVKMEVDRIMAKSEIQCFISRSIPFKQQINEVELY